jgi:uncharacterized delta-60 repeat protein
MRNQNYLRTLLLLALGSLLAWIALPISERQAQAAAQPNHEQIQELLSAKSGDLDPTFGSSGTVITALPGSNSAQKMAIQTDGKIVVQGYSSDTDNNSSFLARYNPDGTVDSSFGTSGKTNIPWVAPLFERFSNGLRILPDGKILISGTVTNFAFDTFAVFRFNADGSRDTSFGMNGVASASVGSAGVGETLSVQPDGKIVVAGNLFNCDSDACRAGGVGVTRFNDNGTIDTSFGAFGQLIIASPNESSGVVDSAALPDGKILLIGEADHGSGTKLLLSRLNPNGTLDASFGANGILHLNLDQPDNFVRQFALQPDGKIVFPTVNDAGQGTSVSTTIVRLNPDGAFDDSFGSKGKVVIPVSEGIFSFAIHIQPNGRILAAGDTGQTPPFGFAIVRLNADGSRDTSFGSNGIVNTRLGSYGSFVTDLALQPNGKLVAYGNVLNYPPGTLDIGLARYVLDSSTPTPTPMATPTPTPAPTPTPTPIPVPTPTPKPNANGKIAYAYTRTINEVHSINADGSNEINLPGFDVTQVWSPDGNRIAFMRDNGIYVMNADGSNRTRITNPQASYDRHPSWSPDGSKIVFSRHRIFDIFSTESESEIYVMNADGSNQTRLGNSTDDYDPSWSPGGTKILFMRGFVIFVMNPDGSNQTQLTDWGNDQPSWSPDGKRIVFTDARHADHYEIYVMNADGSNKTRITNNQTRDREPAWSPDGSLIAFARYQSPNDWNTEEIYVMKPDGSNQTRLTNNQAGDYAPAWSRDGRIVFTTNQVFNSQIYVVNLDGTGRRNLSNNATDDWDPVWSPDGGRIAFQTRGDGIEEIWVMNADGSNQTRLTNNHGWNSYPAWSRDGTRIAFVNRKLGTLCVMNADGSNQTTLAGEGYFEEPAWFPDGSAIVVGGSEIVVINTANGSYRKQLTHTPYGFISTNPAWSPDGTKIAFERRRELADGLYPDEIFVMNADGSNQVNLTNTPTEFEWSPAWTPDGRITFIRDGLYVMNADGSNQTRLSEDAGDVHWGSSDSNAIDDSGFFVRQQYLDFLNREPDPDGLNFWTGEIFGCASDPQCIEVKRINDSASFFLSIEFQETGYLVYRMYKASYGNLSNAPVPIKFDEFLPDTREIGKNVIVRQAGWEQTLENNKQTFATAFVQRQRFVSAYPASLVPDAFVDALFTNAGVTPSGADRSAAIAEFGAATNTADTAARARALRRVAENSTLAQQEFNRAFVLMQYFGYLRRNPNDAPDENFDGYYFWLNKLNNFNGNYLQAEMVKAFLSSSEYRRRFGP